MKKIVKFIKAHQSYAAGDIAGFDPTTADDLIGKKKVAEAYDAPEGNTETLTIKMDGAEAEAKIAAMVKEAEADLEAKAKARSEELDAREAKLKEREGDLAEAEKTLQARSDDLDARAGALTEPAKETTLAKPPKQGSK